MTVLDCPEVSNLTSETPSNSAWDASEKDKVVNRPTQLPNLTTGIDDHQMLKYQLSQSYKASHLSYLSF